MRSMDDVRAFLASGNVGCAETAAAQGRHLIRHAIPAIREVVVLRPVHEVVNSLLSLDLSGVADYDRILLQRNMEYGDRELRKIAKDPNVLVVNYDDLVNEETCARIFEYCLPYGFDRAWWESLKDKNIQVNMKSIIAYYHKNREAINTFKKDCKTELRRIYKSGYIKQVKYA